MSSLWYLYHLYRGGVTYCLSAYMSIRLFVCLSVRLYACLSVCLSVCSSVGLMFFNLPEYPFGCNFIYWKSYFQGGPRIKWRDLSLWRGSLIPSLPQSGTKTIIKRKRFMTNWSEIIFVASMHFNPLATNEDIWCYQVVGRAEPQKR